MKPTIEHSRFGSITIDGQVFNHDVVIRLDGSIERREKQLSKQVFGTSHVLSLAEAEHIYQEGAGRIIIGGGKFSRVRLSPQAAQFFEGVGCQVDLTSTRRAALAWNRAQDKVIGLFHVSC
jgi:hypothetical protein